MQNTLVSAWRRAVAAALIGSLLIITAGQATVFAQSKLRDPNEPFVPVKPLDQSVETYEQLAPSVAFTNPAAITIPAIGTAQPYPSNITVAGVAGTVSKVTVTLNGFGHTYPDDVGVLLVGPTGVKVRLMTDAGGGVGASGGGSVSGVNITFDDAAPNFLPDGTTGSPAITTGTYKPTQGTGGTGQGPVHPANFPAPAPAAPYALTLASFNNVDPNGVWSLYVDDDAAGDSGSIAGGYTIDITAGGGTTCTYTVSPANQTIAAAGGSGSFTVTTQAGCAVSATSNSPFITVNNGTGTGTTTVTFTVAANTGAARSGTITVNGQTFTVNQAAGTTTPPVAQKACYDFFGSGRTSFATARVSNNNILWELRNNTAAGAGAATATLFGATTDFVTPGYFDADNIADISVYRPGTAGNLQGTYFIRPSTAPTTFYGVQWGLTDGNPNSTTNDLTGNEGDYDGDGRDDPTVLRPQNGTYVWYYLRSSNNTFAAVPFGTIASDVPLPGADYTGDGRHDFAVFRVGATGVADSYVIGDSVTSAVVGGVEWGEFNTDFIIVGDYVGDARADFAVWRGFGSTTNGIWYIKENGGAGAVSSFQWGVPGAGTARDVPVCGDYNGDNKSDVAVYRPSNSTFYWLNSGSATGGGNPTPGIAVSGQPGDFAIGSIKTR